MHHTQRHHSDDDSDNDSSQHDVANVGAMITFAQIIVPQFNHKTAIYSIVKTGDDQSTKIEDVLLDTGADVNLIDKRKAIELRLPLTLTTPDDKIRFIKVGNGQVISVIGSTKVKCEFHMLRENQPEVVKHLDLLCYVIDNCIAELVVSCASTHILFPKDEVFQFLPYADPAVIQPVTDAPKSASTSTSSSQTSSSSL